MLKVVKNGFSKGVITVRMMKRMRAAVLCVSAMATIGVAYASESEGLAAANVSLSNMASLQNGAKLFFNYCSGCHALKYMRYSRIAEDLGLSEQQVMDNLNFTSAKFGETVQSTMLAADAEQWFGKAPPDLSLEARAKGSDWIFTYLKSFYLDPSRPVGWNNSIFPNASMPNVLWELQGVQTAVLKPAKPGEESAIEKLELIQPGRLNSEQFDQAARDITAFLQYVGEPAALKRQAMGAWVILYLAVFTFIAWLLKHEYWKDVH